ncbi:50S ribosome-binding GTPase [Candidatus Bathyarchaeota archaeon]|nr:50S ribosome-binding GTPase [Candidatus Bathyarchaeota archaeon]
MMEKYLVFTGRPNAGKSSIIREVLGFDVKIGKNPGTTRHISEYPLSKGLILVDMPGYGKIMRVSERLQDKNNRRTIYFLESNAQRIALAIHVLDISTFSEVTRRLEKKGFISVDVEMVQFLAKILGEFPFVAANKIDKANREEIDDNLKEFMPQISGSDSPSIADHIFPVSAKTGEGLGALKSAIHERIVMKGYKTPFKSQLASIGST